MRGSKGFSLLELLIVLFLILFILTTMTFAVIGQVDKARAGTLMSDARTVRLAAGLVLSEAFGADDETLEEGLSGAAGDTAMPEAIKLSQRMNEILAPHITLAEEPSTEAARVVFDVQGGIIGTMTYETYVGKRRYRVTVPAGGEATAERVN